VVVAAVGFVEAVVGSAGDTGAEAEAEAEAASLGEVTGEVTAVVVGASHHIKRMATVEVAAAVVGL